MTLAFRLIRHWLVMFALAAGIGGMVSPTAAQQPASGTGALAVVGSETQTAAGTAGGTGSAAVEMQAVAAAVLERGEVLTAEDIRYVPLPEGETSPGAPASLVGWTTRRVIQEGEPLRPPAVSPPDLVRGGEPVEVLYQGESVVLRVRGTAARSAALGERVLVRVDARRRLEGVVIGPALVQLEAK